MERRGTGRRRKGGVGVEGRGEGRRGRGRGRKGLSGHRELEKILLTCLTKPT